MAEICWLASYPKSGNTWLRAFLANYMRNPDRPLPINELPNFIFGDGLAAPYLAVSGKASADDLSDEEAIKLRPRVQEMFARSSPDTVFVKTHNAVALVEGMPTIVPQYTGGAVYVIRNPLDVAVSYAHHFEIPVKQAAEALAHEENFTPAHGNLVFQHLGSWSRHVKSWVDAPGMHHHVVRYEDMIRKPVKAFGGVVEFLGMPVNPERLKKALKFSSFREMSSQEKGDGFIESVPDGEGGKRTFFRKGRIGGWRAEIDDALKQRIIDDHKEMMLRFGYLTSDGRLRI